MINLKQIFLWSQHETELIGKLREFGALPKESEVVCSFCKNAMHLWFDDGKKQWFWICRGKFKDSHKKLIPCNNKHSVKKMSVFEGAHSSFEQIIVFIHEWTHHSEIRKIALEASISSFTTAAIYNKFCTEVVINACFENSEPIGECKCCIHLLMS